MSDQKQDAGRTHEHSENTDSLPAMGVRFDNPYPFGGRDASASLSDLPTAVNTPVASRKNSRLNSVATLTDLTALDIDRDEMFYKKLQDRRSSSKTDLPSQRGSVDDFKKQHHERSLSSTSDEPCPISPSTGSEDPEKQDEKGNGTDEKPAAEPPSHGRLLPLMQFLLVYGCLSLAVLLTSLDQTIVACILPSISSKFGAGNSPWVGIAFLLTQTTFAPLYGRMSDVFGRKPVFLVAHVIFFIGTLICALAPSMIVLIIGRAVAGVGGAGLFSMVHICVSDIVTLRKRGTYHGILSAINGTGSAIGPLIGGIFASIGVDGWRIAFYFQLPIIFVAAIALSIFLPRIGHSDVRLLKTKLKTVDYVGIILFIAGTTVFLLGILFIRPPQVPSVSVQVLACILIGVALTVGFLVWEHKGGQSHPIVPLFLLTRIELVMIFFLNFTFGYIFYAVLYYVTQFFQVVSQMSPVDAALQLLPVVVTAIFFSWASGLVTSITGRYKLVIIVAFACLQIGVVLLWNFFDQHISKSMAVAILLVVGIGLGNQMQCTLVACQSAIRQREMAMATGLRNFFRNIGGVFGIAISGMIVHIELNRQVQGKLAGHIPADLLEAMENNPLSLYELGDHGLGQYIPTMIDLFADTFSLVFLLFIPLASMSVIIALFIQEYNLNRAADGEPVPQKVSSWDPRRLSSVCSKKKEQRSELPISA